jgi:hypothetical protein
MESSLLFFLLGLSVFGVTFMIKDRPQWIRIVAFIVTGTLSGAIVGFIGGERMLVMLQLPRPLPAGIGAVAGIVLYSADKVGLIHKPGIQYFVTILLGSILAVISYILLLIYQSILPAEHIVSPPTRLLALSFFLIGFLTVFGYTFPERWFKQQKEKRGGER